MVQSSSLVGTGGGCMWVISARSRSTTMETVTGECQSENRREYVRSTPSCSVSVDQQKSPYTSSPKAAARDVCTPSRLAAMARLAMPPGHDPIPDAWSSVPRTGMDSRPVKTTSKNTVPCTNRSYCSSCCSLIPALPPASDDRLSGQSAR